jgi:cell division protein FtsB
VAYTSEEKVQASVADKQPEPVAASGKSSQKTISALAVFALGLNAAAAVYTSSPSDFVLPDVSRLAELLPHEKAPVQVPETVVAALKDIQSAQQQHLVSLQESSSSLEQNTGLLQQNSVALGSLRQSITDERTDMKKISAQITDQHVDVRKISAQISTLMAKVDSLQNAIAPEITSSIPKGRARNRLSSAAHQKLARQAKPVGPISIGGAPLGFPAFTPVPAPATAPES